jgi:hypothetical protein
MPYLCAQFPDCPVDELRSFVSALSGAKLAETSRFYRNTVYRTNRSTFKKPDKATSSSSSPYWKTTKKRLLAT